MKIYVIALLLAMYLPFNAMEVELKDIMHQKQPDMLQKKSDMQQPKKGLQGISTKIIETYVAECARRGVDVTTTPYFSCMIRLPDIVMEAASECDIICIKTTVQTAWNDYSKDEEQVVCDAEKKLLKYAILQARKSRLAEKDDQSRSWIMSFANKTKIQGPYKIADTSISTSYLECHTYTNKDELSVALKKLQQQ